MKPIIILLILLPAILQGQLSLHAGLNIGGSSGSYSEPYTDPDGQLFNMPTIMAGGELGFRLHERITVRAFYYGTKIDKGAFWEHSANSEIGQYGLKPQVTLYSWNEGKWNLDLGIPMIRWEEKVDWRITSGEWNWFGMGTSSKDSAAGMDKISINQIGLAPTLRYVFPHIRLTCEASLQFFHHNLQSFRREVFYDTIGSTAYDESKGRILNGDPEFRLSVGYSFW